MTTQLTQKHPMALIIALMYWFCEWLFQDKKYSTSFRL